MAKQTFTAAQVLTAAQMNALQSNDFNQTVTTKTASYTPTTAVDAGTRLVMNAAGATTITINTSIYSAGDTLTLLNIGAGVCTLTTGTCTISSAGPLAIPQYGGGTLFFSSASAAVYFPSAGPAASSGLTFISKTTISATTQSNLTNVFSTTFDHYSVRFTDLVGSTDINLRYGTSGTPDTASTYMNTGIYVDSSSVAQQAYAFNAGKSILSNSAGANGSSLFLEISSPFLAKITTYSAVTSSILTGQMVSNCFAGLKNTTTSYTDLVLLSNNNFSCVVSIYGYANS